MRRPHESLAAFALAASIVACSGLNVRATGDGGTIVFGTDGGDAGPGALVSGPGVIACGATSCAGAVPTPLDGQDRPSCCTLGSSSGPGSVVKETCLTSSAGCGSGISYYCDESRDCLTGLVCCEGSGGTVFSCQTSCSAVQLCRTASDCQGAPCTAYRCDGQTIGVCGGLSDAKRKALGC